MNSAHVHLLLNHIPVFATGVGVVLLAVAMARRSDELTRASLAIFVAGALLAIPTYLTGEPAEKVVEHLAGVSEAVIERHEDAALLSIIALEALGGVALAALVLLRRSAYIASRLVVTALVLSMATAGLMARTANLGGQIRHTEIRAQGLSGAAELPASADDDD